MKSELLKLSERIEKGFYCIRTEKDKEKKEKAEKLLEKLVSEYEEKLKTIEDTTDKAIMTRLFILSVKE